MNIRKFAFVSGSIMLILGVLSLIPQLSTFPDWLPALKLTNSYGLFFNLFPMNIVNKVALIAFGIAGIAAANPKNLVIASVRWARTVAWVMGVAAVLGLFPQTNTLWGYWPLLRGEVLLHGVFAVLGGYYGYKSKVTKALHSV